MKKAFKPMSKFRQKVTYGGFGYTPFLAATIILPNIVNALTRVITAFKIFESDSGSTKFGKNGIYESKWDNKNNVTKSNKTDNSINNHIYAY